MDPKIAKVLPYLSDDLVVACAREVSAVAWDRRWGQPREMDLLCVVWTAMPKATDTERNRELERCLSVLRKVGLVKRRMRRGKPYHEPVDTEPSPALVAETIVHELRLERRFEVFADRVGQDSRLLPLLGVSPERAEALLPLAIGGPLRRSYLCGRERLHAASDCV